MNMIPHPQHTTPLTNPNRPPIPKTHITPGMAVRGAVLPRAAPAPGRGLAHARGQRRGEQHHARDHLDAAHPGAGGRPRAVSEPGPGQERVPRAVRAPEFGGVRERRGVQGVGEGQGEGVGGRAGRARGGVAAGVRACGDAEQHARDVRQAVREAGGGLLPQGRGGPLRHALHPRGRRAGLLPGRGRGGHGGRARPAAGPAAAADDAVAPGAVGGRAGQGQGGGGEQLHRPRAALPGGGARAGGGGGAAAAPGPADGERRGGRAGGRRVGGLLLPPLLRQGEPRAHERAAAAPRGRARPLPGAQRPRRALAAPAARAPRPAPGAYGLSAQPPRRARAGVPRV